jgi:hypothetical protein
MRNKKSKQLYHITLEYPGGVFRTIKVQAKSRDVAERRALKRHPNALRVKNA